MSIGNRIKQKRKDIRLTQVELARKLNVSSQVISNWEREYTHPSHEDVTKLADALEVSSDYLLGRSNDDKKTLDDELEAIRNDPKLNLMFDNWKGMSEEERERALEFVNFLIHEREKDK